MALEKPKRKNEAENSQTTHGFSGMGGGPLSFVYTSPWWLVFMVLGWIYIIYQMSGNPDYTAAFRALRQGVPLTLMLAASSYVLALVIGLFVGTVRAYPPQPPETALPLNKRLFSFLQVGLYHVLSVYVEFMRGIPPLVLLLIAGFVIVPAIDNPIEDVINATILPLLRNFEPEMRDFNWKGQSFFTGFVGLSLFYGAFLSEVFRSGIQGVLQGQTDAAKSLGMTYIQTLRFVVIPQAIRAILPELGNNMISMIKDTSLVTILGMKDITQAARTWSGSQFTYVETYAVLSLIYLTLTVPGSLAIQVLERQLRKFALK
ncbi:MAG: amino acid ABC transporter permease [Anaerolineae bacterium]|nr:amino acid ABC transporter permease [Anaerolineae bacterium]MDQ7033705.1 amino acid ABC transporter permease [Anaerolineae bacterium]